MIIANPGRFWLNGSEAKYVMLSFLVHVFTENDLWKRQKDVLEEKRRSRD